MRSRCLHKCVTALTAEGFDPSSGRAGAAPERKGSTIVFCFNKLALENTFNKQLSSILVPQALGRDLHQVSRGFL